VVRRLLGRDEVVMIEIPAVFRCSHHSCKAKATTKLCLPLMLRFGDTFGLDLRHVMSYGYLGDLTLPKGWVAISRHGLASDRPEVWAYCPKHKKDAT
jgi:hypothetical protein